MLLFGFPSIWPFGRTPKSDPIDAAPAVTIAPLVAAEAPVEEKPRKRSREILARYDAAGTTPALQAHWSMADGLSADAANSPHVRKTLRERSRMETGNNPNACGIIRTLGNDVVGTGPRVKVLLKDRPDVNRQIEEDFKAWCRAVRFAKKLRLVRMTRAKDGEIYAILATNPKLPTDVKLDFRPVECDQFTNPFWTGMEEDEVDGIRFDEYGNPVEYCMLKVHPGAPQYRNALETVWISAEMIIHLFLLERPGQCKGVPEMTSSLTIFAMVRGFAMATLDAAKAAAGHTGILRSQEPPDDEDFQPEEPWNSFTAPVNAMTVVPGGYQLDQMKAEHPITGYNEYTSGMLTTAARPVGMSRNVATGDSSNYNFSSSRLDRAIYGKAIEIDQDDLEIECIDRVFDAWWLEYRDVADLPEDVQELDHVPHECHWDQPIDIDPQKTASARQINLQNGMTSYQSEYAAMGLDAETEMRKQADTLGIDYEVYQQKLLDALFTPQPGMPAGDTPPAGNPLGGTGEGQSSPSAGVFQGARKRDFTNNIKQTREVLDGLIGGTVSESMAKIALSRLGYTPQESAELIKDARDGQIDDPDLQEGGGDA